MAISVQSDGNLGWVDSAFSAALPGGRQSRWCIALHLGKRKDSITVLAMVYSFGINKGKSCSFWGLVCLVWSITVKEQGTRQGPSMKALFTSYSLGKKHSMLREVSCAKTYYSIAGLTEILCKQSLQWAWDSGPCSGFPAGENNVKKMKTNLFHCCMEMRRGLPLILKEPCALPMPKPGITSKALPSGTGSITCLRKSVSYTYCIKI